MRGRVNSQGVEEEKEDHTFKKKKHKERKREQKRPVHAPKMGNEQGENKVQFQMLYP